MLEVRRKWDREWGMGEKLVCVFHYIFLLILFYLCFLNTWRALCCGGGPAWESRGVVESSAPVYICMRFLKQEEKRK